MRDDADTVSREEIPEPLRGLWRSHGYNWLLQIERDGFARYTVTDAHASLFERGNTREFLLAFDRIELTPGGRLRLFHAHDVTRYEFERMDAWNPAVRLYSPLEPDPLLNFEAFCEVFAENYAFFDLHAVNWNQLCNAGRRRLSAAPDLNTLRAVIEEMITPLGDMHVYVSTPELKIRSAVASRGPRRALQKLFDLNEPQLSRHDSIARIAPALAGTLLREYAGSMRGFRQSGNGAISWGSLTPQVGYLGLLRMFGFAESQEACRANDLPHLLSKVGPFLRADMERLDAILDEALDDLAHVERLIIDVRLNGGGFDRAGLLVASRLIERPQVVYIKKAKSPEGFTAPQPIMLLPSNRRRFGKPVVVLVSALTVSAGEVFALTMRSLPNVTVLGERTQGILSDNLFHQLPNGWEVSLSNEVYSSNDGECFEFVGVPPEQPLPPLTEQRLLDDMRDGLRIAVSEVY